MKSWDVFISHAIPDKVEFVLPLAEALRERGLNVWLDRWTIDLGDSISESISEGLRLSKFGIVVLSNAFFARSWPKKELGALFAKESDGASHIIPIWHQIEYNDVWEHAPLLVDRMAARSDDGVINIADRVVRLVARENRVIPGLTAADVRSLTRKLFPHMRVDLFWEAQLIADLDVKLYRSIGDIELAYRRARRAVEAYAKEQPSMFRSGTDFLTKSLGFVDLCFRTRHRFGSRTHAAFERHADKVKWDIEV